MGSGQTTRNKLEYPLGTDPAAIPTDVQGLATGLDAILSPWTQATSAPVSPIQGQTWWNPTATASTFGLNYYDGTTWWNLLSGPQYIGSTAPSAALCYPGLLWVNTSFTCTQLQICTAGGVTPTWLIILPGSNSTGQALINTGSGIAWGTVSGTGLPLSGGTMTGPIVLSGAPTTGLNPATKTYADAITTAWTAAVAACIQANNNNATLTSPLEPTFVTSTAPASTMNIFVSTNSSSILITTNAANNFIFNIEATNAPTTLNSLLANNSEITIAVRVKQGSTPYYCTGIQIDGTLQTVNWQGGTAPSFGYASGYDVYTINIVKTAASTYTVFAALTQF